MAWLLVLAACHTEAVFDRAEESPVPERVGLTSGGGADEGGRFRMRVAVGEPVVGELASDRFVLRLGAPVEER